MRSGPDAHACLRVLQEIEFVKSNQLRPAAVEAIRQNLLREFNDNLQDNGYLLGQIARKYEDREGSNVGAVVDLPAQIAALTGEAIQSAAQTYLDTRRT